jgi:hypothetical protein
MGSLLERLAERETAARERIARLRAEIVSLSAELAGEEETLSRLAITRETVVGLLAGDDDASLPGPVAWPRVDPVAVPERVGVSAADRQVLDAFAAAGRPLRAKDVCQLLEVGADARQVEGMRHRLKRMVGRRVLAEPEPGMFVVAGPPVVVGPAATDTEV